MKREVTERDFRKPEFIDANPEDYEIREDGKVARKDRWQTGFRNVASIVVGARAKYEIEDVVRAVDRLAGNWVDADPDEDPEITLIDVKLSCGSVLKRLERRNSPFTYHWEFGAIDFKSIDFGADVIEWQPSELSSIEPEA